MLTYHIHCRCGHQMMTPVRGKLRLRAAILRLMWCSRCGQQAAEDMRILWDAGGQALDGVHLMGTGERRKYW
ncbi:hypothetical protein [Pseudooceanicola nanhaiensis]|nr:hypothetical protein [Pseudooceanicola nanhaiensis]